MYKKRLGIIVLGYKGKSGAIAQAVLVAVKCE